MTKRRTLAALMAALIMVLQATPALAADGGKGNHLGTNKEGHKGNHYGWVNHA